jgi:hypothetical protein
LSGILRTRREWRLEMRKTLLIVLLTFVTSLRLGAQTAAAVEQELIKLEQTLGDASVKKDRATLERVFATDYMYTTQTVLS